MPANISTLSAGIVPAIISTLSAAVGRSLTAGVRTIRVSAILMASCVLDVRGVGAILMASCVLDVRGVLTAATRLR